MNFAESTYNTSWLVRDDKLILQEHMRNQYGTAAHIMLFISSAKNTNSRGKTSIKMCEYIGKRCYIIQLVALNGINVDCLSENVKDMQGFLVACILSWS